MAPFSEAGARCRARASETCPPSEQQLASGWERVTGAPPGAARPGPGSLAGVSMPRSWGARAHVLSPTHRPRVALPRDRDAFCGLVLSALPPPVRLSPVPCGRAVDERPLG